MKVAFDKKDVSVGKGTRVIAGYSFADTVSLDGVPLLTGSQERNPCAYIIRCPVLEPARIEAGRIPFGSDAIKEPTNLNISVKARPSTPCMKGSLYLTGLEIKVSEET